MGNTHRFSGQLAEEYELITLAYPDFEQFQRRMVDVITDQAAPAPRILEIGTGNGFTTRMLMQIPESRITTVDNDPQMVAHAREQLRGPAGAGAGTVDVVEADALEFLQEQRTASFDVVASAFTLHNMETTYRNPVEAEVFRVLRPAGLFTNADKYAPEGQEQFDALVYQVERFFDAFVKLGKLDLLRKWVTHNITDQSPQFVMPAATTPDRLSQLGFTNVEVGNRSHMQAVLTAWKPE
ncbi:MAG: class I SAM-dependent methyltransferase [Alkalispirochaeta sp.]